MPMSSLRPRQHASLVSAALMGMSAHRLGTDTEKFSVLSELPMGNMLLSQSASRRREVYRNFQVL